jgi:hypothetical protein
LRIAEQVRAGNMVVVPDFAAPLGAEICGYVKPANIREHRADRRLAAKIAMAAR